MRREKQYDMFDVATGTCSLDDYLFQRYSENDLSSSFWIDEKDEVDELRAPKPQPDGRPGTEPEVIPIQGPRASKKPGPSKPPPLPEGLTPDAPPGPAKTVHLQNPGSELARADGRDSVVEQQPEMAGTDSVQKNSPVGPNTGMESFQPTLAQPKETPSAETFQRSLEGDPGTPPAPQAPSMEDLLARFHEATKEYEQRSQTGSKGEPKVPEGPDPKD